VTDLLRFYVIFRPAEGKEDTPASPCQTVLAVSMDDSLQYRCAGTIQAAIEKYIDHIGGKQPVHGTEASSVLSGLDDDERPKQKDAQKGESARFPKPQLLISVQPLQHQRR
jgi:cohesin complex subunit SA-1/2